MQTTEKKRGTKQPNEFLIAARIDRELSPLSMREQTWILQWLCAKYSPTAMLSKAVASTGSAMPEWSDTAKGPDYGRHERIVMGNVARPENE